MRTGQNLIFVSIRLHGTSYWLGVNAAICFRRRLLKPLTPLSHCSKSTWEENSDESPGDNDTAGGLRETDGMKAGSDVVQTNGIFRPTKDYLPAR